MLPQDLCEVYRDANLRFPQVEVGIVSAVAAVMLRHGPDYMAAALLHDFSALQLAAIRDAMDRSHAARHVPVRSELTVDRTVEVVDLAAPVSSISDDRLRLVWRNITYYVVDAIVDCLEALRPQITFVRPPTDAGYPQLGAEVTERLRHDPELLRQAADVFAIAGAVLDGDEARALARQFRASVNYRDIALAREEVGRAKRDLQRSLAILLADAMTPQYPSFAALIRDYSWRAFRRDVHYRPS